MAEPDIPIKKACQKAGLWYGKGIVVSNYIKFLQLMKDLLTIYILF